MSAGGDSGRAWRRPKQEPVKRGMEPLSDVVGRVLRSVSGKNARVVEEVEQAWREAVTDRVWSHTRPVGMRRGVLTVEVDHSVLLQELAAFEKELLLQALRGRVSRVYIEDLRFRLGRARSSQA